ncbi:hypothetical protein [Burkholderia stagnalis]|uniref:Uncharacterized protein n=1 Tax=Burkholderia stagnalis TaxID=1503054 RepID=A0A6L3N1D9_9BURK|nr:hypothetical protein [Burkholderia stagnalis]KAB0639918.1 hypothetical protein F7R25_06270 [Burkholderia stagnalis]
MDKSTLVISVKGATSREANLLCSNLEDQLNHNVRGIELSRRKDDGDSLDLGTTIVAIIGTQFAVEMAKTLHAWLLRNNSADVTVNGFHVSGVSPEDVKDIIQMQLDTRRGNSDKS